MKHEFENTEIKKLVLKLGIPAMFAQFFNVLYSIVDRIFVGNIAGEGELALAAVGVCAPVLTAISAFAYMVGIWEILTLHPQRLFKVLWHSLTVRDKALLRAAVHFFSIIMGQEITKRSWRRSVMYCFCVWG